MPSLKQLDGHYFGSVLTVFFFLIWFFRKIFRDLLLLINNIWEKDRLLVFKCFSMQIDDRYLLSICIFLIVVMLKKQKTKKNRMIWVLVKIMRWCLQFVDVQEYQGVMVQNKDISIADIKFFWERNHFSFNVPRPHVTTQKKKQKRWYFKNTRNMWKSPQCNVR